MFYLRVIFIACLAFVTLTNSQNIPSDIQRCAYTDEKCLVRTVQDILKKHYKGHQGFNIIPLDALIIKSLIIRPIPGSPVSIDLKLKDASFVGLSKGTVTKVAGFKRDITNVEFDVEVKVPKLTLSGMYEINGQVIGLPISGKGICTGIFEDVLIVAKGICDSKDKIYLNVRTVEMDFQPKRVKYNFENLFDGNKELGDKMNKFLNENSELLFSELKPLVDESLAKILLHTANGPFSKIPYSQLFLEN